jgi:hypothetical protein
MAQIEKKFSGNFQNETDTLGDTMAQLFDLNWMSIYPGLQLRVREGFEPLFLVERRLINKHEIAEIKSGGGIITFLEEPHDMNSIPVLVGGRVMTLGLINVIGADKICRALELIE